MIAIHSSASSFGSTIGAAFKLVRGLLSPSFAVTVTRCTDIGGRTERLTASRYRVEGEFYGDGSGFELAARGTRLIVGVDRKTMH